MASRKGRAGGTLMVGVPGTELDQATARWLGALRPAGVILFSRNLETPGQTAALVEALVPLLGKPGLLAVDQEGGRVSRLASWIGPTPSAASLAGEGEAATRRFASATGRSLAALGFNLDFAPVVDLCGPEQTNGIGDRSFGTDPRRVTRMARAFLQGLQEDAGIAGCLKHFPGLGDTTVDSHEVLPVVRRSLERLRGEDLLPYRELAAMAASVMVGHGHYDALDTASTPATCSERVVRGLLRGELDFRGLAVSDDLEMGAVAGLDAEGGAAVLAMSAGCDLLLYCGDPARAERAAAALETEAHRSPTMRQRLERAAHRVLAFAADWPLRPADVRGFTAARTQLREFARLA